MIRGTFTGLAAPRSFGEGEREGARPRPRAMDWGGAAWKAGH